MADTATTVNEITTHFFGDMMARDLGFSGNTNCYGAPRARWTHAARSTWTTRSVRSLTR
jgi:regulator of sirC expression with transglutaminase-like and TPR domain